MIDLDDTSNCPDERCCACCNRRRDVEICTLTTPIGVLCQPMCADCVSDGTAPRISVQGAADLVARHCEHLGIDLDQMARAMRQKDTE